MTLALWWILWCIIGALLCRHGFCPLWCGTECQKMSCSHVEGSGNVEPSHVIQRVPFQLCHLACDARGKGMQKRRFGKQEELRGRGRKHWGNKRQWAKEGMRWVKASEEEEWKGGEERSIEKSLCSDTTLCVAMVQAQSELLSSFTAQLANYPQSAILIRRQLKASGFPRLFDCCTDTTVRAKEWFICIYADNYNIVIIITNTDVRFLYSCHAGW